MQVLTRSFCPLEALVCGVLDHARLRAETPSFSRTTSALSLVQDAVCADLEYVCQVVLRYGHPCRVGGGGVAKPPAFLPGYPADSGVTRATILALWEAGVCVCVCACILMCVSLCLFI